jgi:UDP-N-acetylmuramate--alanine ligase
MLEKNLHLHFIGVCGIGMSGIAKILLQQGYKVSGCDQNLDPARTEELTNLGCKIGHHQSDICNDSSISMIVRSSDVALTHPEIIAAQAKNIPIKLRAEILSEIMSLHKNSIAVAGAHGKTTTSSLLSHVLLQADRNPTVIVGGHIHQLNSNAKYGNGNYLVAEADESDKSFLLLPKKYAITTNIDREHLGVYKDLDDIKENFINFINSTPPSGLNIICIDDPGIQTIINSIQSPYITYGTSPNATFQIQDINLEPYQSHFTLINNQTKQNLGSWSVTLAGHHNILNTTSIIALCLTLGLTKEEIQEGLITFQGVDRRFTYKGKTKEGALVFDDYGHHPTEIDAVLKVARNATKGKLIVAFQPQRFSRTKSLWPEFITSLAQANVDSLIITDIYAANEAPIQGISSPDLVREIRKINPHISISYIPFLDNGKEIIESLNSKLNQEDLLLFLGAGKINKLIPYMILNK